MKISFFDAKLNKSQKEVKLGIEAEKPSIVLQSIRVALFNGRKARAVTKTKAMVSGGGKKPWRQKGTGRARTGSTRNPHWVGGGVAHGPQNINWSLNIPKTFKKIAFKSALLKKINDQNIYFVDFSSIKEVKTKSAKNILNTVVGDKFLTEPTLVVTNKEDNIVKSFNNLKNVKTVSANVVSTKDIVGASKILISSNSEKVFLERVK